LKAPIDIRPIDLEIVQNILRNILPESMKIWVFGSRAKWTKKDSSDLDIPIDIGRKLTKNEVSKLEDAFEESNLPYKVDFVDLYNVSDSFKEIIEQDKVEFPLLGDVGGVMEGWKTLPLKDIMKFGNGKPRPRTKGCIPIYGGNGILGYGDKTNYDEETIVIGRVGAYCGATYYENKPIWVSDNALSAKPKKGNNAKFLYYLLKQMRLNQYSQGSSHPLLTHTLLNSIEVNITTDPKRQKRIADVLTAFDDKIATNQQINQTLEDMAQAIFKSLFVDFEPVKAKIVAVDAGGNADDANLAAMCAISGKSIDELHTLKSTDEEAYTQLHTTASLFPSALVESELGLIPDGWEVKTIKNAVNTISQTYPLKEVSEVVFLNTGDILNGKFLHSKKSDASILPGQAKKSIQKGDILYSEIRPENKRFAFVNFDSKEYVVSTKLMVLRSNADISSLFIYFILTQQITIDYLQMMAESRSGTFPQITFQALSQINYIAPSDNQLIHTFTKNILEPFYKKFISQNEENTQLEQLCDSLLPKLLSGEISVGGEEEKEAAVILPKK
jgi:type I restriction enzyme S subunit